MEPSGGASEPRLPAQQKTDAVDVEGEDGECRHAGEAVRPAGQDPVKAPVPEIVDRRSAAGCRRRIALSNAASAPPKAGLSSQTGDNGNLKQWNRHDRVDTTGLPQWEKKRGKPPRMPRLLPTANN